MGFIVLLKNRRFAIWNRMELKQIEQPNNINLKQIIILIAALHLLPYELAPLRIFLTLVIDAPAFIPV